MQAAPLESAAGPVVELSALTQRFGRRRVYSDVSATVRRGEVLAVTGVNGSGKSTLMRVVAGLLTPTGGSVRIEVAGTALARSGVRANVGYVAPDLQLYAELTGVENLLFLGRLRGVHLTRDDLAALLGRVGLMGRGRDLVGAYSSGMRQRLKYAAALMHRPPILLLDEPTANLDGAGACMVEEVVADQRMRGIAIVATNEPREAAWGNYVVRLGGS